MLSQIGPRGAGGGLQIVEARNQMASNRMKAWHIERMARKKRHEKATAEQKQISH
jgi:hypothetical protein